MDSQDPSGDVAGAPPSAYPGADDLGDLTLPSGSALPRAARATVRGWLDGRVPAGVLRDAQLLVSELVTNAYLHADGAGGAGGAPVRIRGGSTSDSVWF